ncbi:hypothetical protein C7H85_02595 [Zobellella endophytica]|uniref:Sulfotransferase n=1 Tax=Zobellella endophytica TaxID=2116700 RepID=A0A2P7RC29_9GAMM|nr:sulfotransferase [Zobellella endophytica]PSJ47730.1 hypothetical protein C7H85_02595 [Zobellella endophytica]
MMILTLLRRLAEQQAYFALQEACLQESSTDPAVTVLLALAMAQLGDRGGARAMLERLDIAALDRDARVDLGAVHLALGDLDCAVELLEAELRRDKAPHSLLLARLGFCRQHQGQIDEALTLFRQSLSLTPRMPVFLNLLRLYAQQQVNEGWAVLARAEACWRTERGHWPADSVAFYDQQLRGLRLDLWLLDEAFDAAESWLEVQRGALPAADWCALLAGYARRLQGRDRHAQAEERLRAGLNHYPDNRLLLTQLAELAQLQGRTAQCLALLRRAIRCARDAQEPSVGLWLQLASHSIQFDPATARHAIDQAGAELDGYSAARLPAEVLAELNLQLRLARAGLAGQEQKFDEAVAAYRQVLEEQPGNVPAWQGLGQLLMQLGRIDEAVECFEQLKSIDPARGHSALINARHFPDDDATLERLETLARTPGQEGSVRASLLLQLAVAWEKRKDYDRAFALADEANAAARRLLNYDPKAHRQRCARVRHAFNRALYEHRPGCGVDSRLPVFVLGMPRSGTTLVEQIIAGHSRIHGAGELGIMPRVITGLERWERRAGSGRGYPDCVDDLDARVSRGIAGYVLKELQEYAPEALHVVDKLPHNFENIGLIKLLFPHARIISVRRDPRDIALSNYFTDYAAKHGGMGFAYHLEWIGEQLADHNLLMHHWNQVFPGEILEVQYEAVIADPEASARMMLDYIGVAWEPQVLNFSELERPVKTASVWQVRQPIYHSSREKWRRYERHLAPLIAGTNRKIRWEPIEMVTLPEPGWLSQGVDQYRAGLLDEAERCFKQLLHFVPGHAAAHFMLGLVYCDKGHLADGIGLMEKALAACPWNRQWREDLARAWRLHGRPDRAGTLLAVPNRHEADGIDPEYHHDGDSV